MQIKRESRFTVNTNKSGYISLFIIDLFSFFSSTLFMGLPIKLPLIISLNVPSFFSFSVRHMREREGDDANSTVWASSGVQVSEEAYIFLRVSLFSHSSISFISLTQCLLDKII